jgi:hypothetical protein
MTPSRTKAVDARTREALNSPADLRPESPMAALLAWPLEEGERVLSCRWADGSWLLTGRDVGRAQDAQQRFWMGQPEVARSLGRNQRGSSCSSVAALTGSPAQRVTRNPCISRWGP